MNFAECVICKQGVLSFDALDKADVCFKPECQQVKDKIVNNLMDTCKHCGVYFLNDIEDSIFRGICNVCKSKGE